MIFFLLYFPKLLSFLILFLLTFCSFFSLLNFSLYYSYVHINPLLYFKNIFSKLLWKNVILFLPNLRWNFPLRSARYDPIKRKGSIDRYKKERGRKKMYDTDHAGHDKSFRYLFSPIGRVTSPSCRHEVLPYYFVSLDLLLFRRVLKETRFYSLTRWSFSIPVWLVTRPERS